MKLSKINKLLFGSFIILLISCNDNSAVISKFKDSLISDMIAETKVSRSKISSEIDRLIIKEDTHDCMPSRFLNSLTNFQSEKDSTSITIDAINNYSNLFIDNNIKKLLSNFATYKQGKYNWSFDSTTFDKSKCNPLDTLYIKKILDIRLGILKSIHGNHQLIKLSLNNCNQLINRQKLNKFNIPCCFCFKKLNELLHYENKVFYQNENSSIIPGFSTYDKSYIAPIYILKENSNDFIMKNGEKKKFTNPINLKASSKKGVHTVKGVVMVKQKGELVPKSFEFRYIVE